MSGSNPARLYLLIVGRSFLNDIDRIATRTYEPSDDDIVRARLRTTGIQEHRLTFESERHQRLYHIPTTEV